MGTKQPPQLVLLLLCCLVALGQASEQDDADYYNHHRHPLAGHHQKDDASGDERQDGSSIPPGSTPQATEPPYTVSSLTEAITLAVMSGICGPSLFALLGCWIRQVRLTWDDPFAGGERPVDEAAERRKRKKEQRQQQELQGEDEEDEGYISNNFPGANVVKNNLDPMNLDNVVSLDLDKIRARPLLTAKYSNTEKNLASRVNAGYSKTAEDIL